MKLATPSRYVGYAEAEEATGIKRGTLYSLVSRKRVPHIRLGRRHILFDLKELFDWITTYKVDAREIQ